VVVVGGGGWIMRAGLHVLSFVIQRNASATYAQTA